MPGITFCAACGDDLTFTGHCVNADCPSYEWNADIESDDYEDFMNERFDMETEKEYMLRKENRW